jgi:AraC family transcriptional regulator
MLSAENLPCSERATGDLSAQVSENSKARLPVVDLRQKLPPGVTNTIVEAQGVTFIDTRVVVAGALPQHSYSLYQVVVNTWAPAKIEWWSQAGGKKSLVLAKGDIICQPAGDLHSCSWEIPWSHSSFLLSQSSIDELAAKLGLPAGATSKVSHLTCDPLISQLTQSLIAERESEPLSCPLYAQSVLSFLSHRLLMRLARSSAKLQTAQREESLSPLLLEKVVAYIGDHIGKSVSLADLARVASTSPFHFSRLFKNATGMSPHAFVLSRRTTIACQFLEEGEDSLAAIATKSGFSSQSHMGRAFKKMLKVSPAAYRQQVKGGDRS